MAAMQAIESDRKLPQEVVVEALQEALAKAFRKHIEIPDALVRVDVNEKTGNIKVYQQRTIVETVEDDELEISLEDAKKINQELELDGVVEEEVDITQLGRAAVILAKNVMKQKSFHKGIEQLVQEGAIQLYTNYQTGEYMLGAVGQLQFEVFKHRMENEYNAEVVMTPMGKKTVRWIQPEDLDERMSSSRNILAKDRFDQPVFLFENDFALRWFADKYPDVTLEENM